VTSSKQRRSVCIYCGKRADSEEHIIATRFVEVLAKDPRGLPLPIRLEVTLPDRSKRRIGGKKTKRGHYTVEYTSRVCQPCNSGWMNDIDSAAFPYLTEMIQGHSLTLDNAAREKVAAWVCKVAVTARAAPHTRLPIEKEWTDWLYENHSALPGWFVWIARYEGSHPWWYCPEDVRTELGPDQGSAPPGLVRNNGVLATLVVGRVALQVFGLGGGAEIHIPEAEQRTFPRIWPPRGLPTVTVCPPEGYVDDAGLPLWAKRMLINPSPRTLPGGPSS
jgi:hypothetical protein